MNRQIALPLALTVLGACTKAEARKPKQADKRPNIIMIYIDDMGYADISSYGGTYAQTPNMDRIGEEGIRFTQYYSACPISSPSRIGLTTGTYPTRWGVTTFLNNRKANLKNESNDYLLAEAPTMARSLKSAGYATGHFGKWHMGGGRDVDNAPAITEYGFDEYNSTWESPDPDPKLTSENWIWGKNDEVKRWDRTAYFVDKTLDFLKRHPDQPCFVNLWPDDMHTPYVPSKEAYEHGNKNSFWSKEENYTPVLEELDRQIGRLLDGLKELGMDDNTLILFTSDNGPNPSYKNARTGGLRGQKGQLYEGGIRMPFMVRWPARIKPGQVNTTTVMCSVDIFPTLCSIAGVKWWDRTISYDLDGLDMSRTLTGKQKTVRKQPLFWEFGKQFVKDSNREGKSPNIAMRDGDWKLLVNYDGTQVELYDLYNDVNETTNVADEYPKITEYMKKAALEWFNTAFRQYAGELGNTNPNVGK